MKSREEKDREDFELSANRVCEKLANGDAYAERALLWVLEDAKRSPTQANPATRWREPGSSSAS